MAVLEAFFLPFLAAHVAADFLFQSDRDILHKSRPTVLAKHGAIHAVLTVGFAGTLSVWVAALSIAVAHVAIDYGKQRISDGGWRAFLVDQAFHIAVLLVAAHLTLATAEPSLWVEVLGGRVATMLAVGSGLVVTVTAGAYFVDLAVQPFLAQIRTADANKKTDDVFKTVERTETRMRGLRDGGATIGRLERALIFVFVLINQFGAIGFLIAAKSIFRFGELRERANRMEAEYIIIGTLISFLWAIVAALLTRLLAGL